MAWLPQSGVRWLLRSIRRLLQSVRGWLPQSVRRCLLQSIRRCLLESVLESVRRWLLRSVRPVSSSERSLVASSERSLVASSERSSLPIELIEEILCRTPPESLIRFKPSCKEWYALITNKRFIYRHLRHSPERFIRSADEVDTIRILDPVTRTRSFLPLPKDFGGPPKHMLHCDGFIMCTFDDWSYREGDEPRYFHCVLWNPILREVRWIDPFKDLTSSDHYGIGYDKEKSPPAYMILRFSVRGFKIDEDEADAEIYDLKTESVRPLEVDIDWIVDVSCIGVSLKGSMYWFAKERIDQQNQYILCFDFSDERFKNKGVCPPSNDDRDNYLSSYGDSLSLLQQSHESNAIHIWVSNRIGDGNICFQKHYSVSLPDLPALHIGGSHPAYIFAHPKAIFAWCEGAADNYELTYTLFEINQTGVSRRSEIERCYCASFFRFMLPYRHCAWVFVPSLVSPP